MRRRTSIYRALIYLQCWVGGSSAWQGERCEDREGFFVFAYYTYLNNTRLREWDAVELLGSVHVLWESTGSLVTFAVQQNAQYFFK